MPSTQSPPLAHDVFVQLSMLTSHTVPVKPATMAQSALRAVRLESFLPNFSEAHPV